MRNKTGILINFLVGVSFTVSVFQHIVIEKLTPIFSMGIFTFLSLIIFMLIYLCLLQYVIFTRLFGLGSKNQFLILVTVSLFSTGLILAFPIHYSIPALKVMEMALLQKEYFYLIKAILFIADVVSLGSLLLLITLYVVVKEKREVLKPLAVEKWLIAGALGWIIIWSLYLIAFFPGMMSADTIDQWKQITTRNFFDWHPAFHTLTMWLITRVWFSPASVAVVQIFLLSLVLIYLLNTLKSLGVSNWGIIVSVVLIAATPLTATMAITLYKDVFYTTAFVLFSAFLVKVVTSEGVWLEQRGMSMWFGLVGALVSLFRHNGIYVVFGTFLVLIFSYPKIIRAIVRAGFLTIILYAGVRGPLYEWLDVDREMTVLKTSPFLFQVAAHIDAGTSLRPDQIQYLNEIWPSSIKVPYVCNNINPIQFGGILNTAPIIASPERLMDIFWTTLLKDPKVNFRNITCQSSLVWRISYPPNKSYATVPLYGEGGTLITMPPNDLGLALSPLFPDLTSSMADFLFKSMRAKLSWLIWRPAIWLYISIFSFFLTALRLRSWRCLLVIFPLIVHSAIVFLVTLAPFLRYQYPACLMGLVSIALFFPNSSQLNLDERNSYPDCN